MEEGPRTVAPVDTRHYRELAEKLRNIASQSRFPRTRQKILDFALGYDGRADQLDERGAAAVPRQTPVRTVPARLIGWAWPVWPKEVLQQPAHAGGIWLTPPRRPPGAGPTGSVHDALAFGSGLARASRPGRWCAGVR